MAHGNYLRNREVMDITISKTLHSLTSAEDMRNQTKLIMQPYANWEEYLTPAPLSIAILGELAFISSTTDFSINKNPPKDGYTYIKYPESFRACLLQVCHSGWSAFNEAHTSMDQIRLHTSQVPDYIKTAVKILFQDNDEVIQAHLPDQLKNIQVIADECLKLSATAESHFKDVIKIIGELLQACVNAETFYGKEMEAMQRTIKENKLREQSAEENKKRTEKAVNALENELDNAYKAYNKAVDSFPSAWNIVGMNLVGELSQTVTSLINGVLFFSQSIGSRQMSNAAINIADTISRQEPVRDPFDEINSYSKSGEILRCAQKIKDMMNVSGKDDDIDWNQLYNQKEKTTTTDFYANQFERIKEDLGKIRDSKPKSEAEVLCLKGINICIQLANCAPEGKCDKDKSTKIIEEVLELINSARVFDSKSKNATKSPAIFSKPPMMFKTEKSQDNKRNLQTATENARFAIEQSRAQLNKTREIYEKSVENLEKNQKELTEILIILRTYDSKMIDFKTTTEMLVKGMDAMGRVQQQWEKMVQFFQMVSAIVKTCLNKTLKNFVETSKKTQCVSYNAKLFSKDLLYIQAFKASDIASLVNMISGTYTEVSSKYLMDNVSSLSVLMTMDKSKPEFLVKRQKLQDSCDAAQKEILRLVLKNKEEYEKKSTARQKKIDDELLAILPAAPPEETKRIQEVVQAAFSDEDDVSHYG